MMIVVKEGEILINAPHGKEFIFQDGTRAKNILELVSVIETLSDHGFHHFVNAHKNDFANWVDHVLENKSFSDRLREVSTKSDTVRLIKEEISDSASKWKIGGSIMNIMKLEDRSKSHKDDHIEDTREHPSDAHGHDPHKSENHPKDKHEHHETTENHKEGSPENIDIKEEKAEKKIEAKASRQWFRIFSKKKLSEKNIEALEQKEEKQFKVEQEVKEEIKNDGHENALWVILYIALIILIISLLMYKLFM